MNSSKILITGAAGFIGYHLCKSLLEDGYEVLADIKKSIEKLGYKPITTINKGIKNIIQF